MLHDADERPTFIDVIKDLESMRHDGASPLQSKPASSLSSPCCSGRKVFLILKLLSPNIADLAEKMTLFQDQKQDWLKELEKIMTGTPPRRLVLRLPTTDYNADMPPTTPPSYFA
jgi:hypothetical protein